jgi:hypothetical protein
MSAIPNWSWNEMVEKMDRKTTILSTTGGLALIGGFFAFRAKATLPFKVGDIVFGLVQPPAVTNNCAWHTLHSSHTL